MYLCYCVIVQQCNMGKINVGLFSSYMLMWDDGLKLVLHRNALIVPFPRLFSHSCPVPAGIAPDPIPFPQVFIHQYIFHEQDQQLYFQRSARD